MFKYRRIDGDDVFEIVDGVNGRTYDWILNRTFAFDSSNSFHYIALKGNAIYWVEETINKQEISC